VASTALAESHVISNKVSQLVFTTNSKCRIWLLRIDPTIALQPTFSDATSAARVGGAGDAAPAGLASAGKTAAAIIKVTVFISVFERNPGLT
jgi:hypothetical protein